MAAETFITRLALILVCAALAVSGYAIVMPPCLAHIRVAIDADIHVDDKTEVLESL